MSRPGRLLTFPLAAPLASPSSEIHWSSSYADGDPNGSTSQPYGSELLLTSPDRSPPWVLTSGLGRTPVARRLHGPVYTGLGVVIGERF